MTENITTQIHALRKMTVTELQAKHLELFGTDTKSKHKDQLFKRLAWRVQELVHGGLSERAKRRAEEIANDLDARFCPPSKPNNGKTVKVASTQIRSTGSRPMPGTILQRKYQGVLHQVTVTEDGFEYGDKIFKSLSGVAKTITGTQWNGNLFFGLRKRTTNGDR